MSTNDISEIYIPRPSRARRQRWLGLVLMTLLSVFVSCAIVWGYGEAQYRNCLGNHDSAYKSVPGLEQISWSTTKTAAAAKCAQANLLPPAYLM